MAASMVMSVSPSKLSRPNENPVLGLGYLSKVARVVQLLFGVTTRTTISGRVSGIFYPGSFVPGAISQGASVVLRSLTRTGVIVARSAGLPSRTERHPVSPGSTIISAS